MALSTASTIRHLRSQQQQRERLHFNTISQEDINDIQVIRLPFKRRRGKRINLRPSFLLYQWVDFALFLMVAAIESVINKIK